MTSSKSRRPPRSREASRAPQLLPAKRRPRDLLQATAFPIHPFDQVHGVDTSGLLPAKHLLTGHPNDEHVTAYYAVAPSILRSLIDHWRETIPHHPISSYSFVDVGCGKGRGLLVASEYRFRRVIGIELNPQLATTARSNALQWQRAHDADPTADGVAEIEVVEQDALDLQVPSTPTLLFLFHPFEAPVMEQFIESIDRQLRPRRVPVLDLIYVNAECADVLDGHPAFSQLFLGQVKMSPEDHAADLEAIAQQKEYGSTGDEQCAIYRYTGQTLGGDLKPAA